MSDTNELQDSQNLPDVSSQDTQKNDEQSGEDLSSLSREELLERNRQLYARLQKTKNEKQKGDKSEAVSEQPEPPKNTDSMSEFERKQELKLDLRMEGYTAEEIRFIERNSNGNLFDAVERQSGKLQPKDDYVKTAILGMRKKQRVDQTTPAPSQRAAVETTIQSFRETPKEDRAKKFSPQAWREQRRKG